MPNERGSTIQSVGPQNIAQASLGLKGGDVPQNILVPDLLGTIELGRRTEPELLFEQDILPFGVVWSIAAGGAGTFALVDVAIASDIIIVEKVFCDGAPGAKIVVAWTATAIGAPGAVPVFSRDSRFGQNIGTGRVPLINVGTAAAFAGANIIWRSGSLNTSAPNGSDQMPWIVQGNVADATGNHLQIGLDTANQPFSGGMWGYAIPRRPQ